MAGRDFGRRGSHAASIAALAARPAVVRALRWLEQHPLCESETVRVAEIPAPTFAERDRSRYVERRLRELGADDVYTFGHDNVVARLGPDRGNGIALLAHLDTVFAAGIDVHVRREPGRLSGPGVGDNSAGVAGLLAAVAALRAAETRLAHPVWFVANVGEEGLGDLLGARETMAHLGHRLDAVLAIEGTMLGRLGHIAVGSRRLRARFRGRGGHSWLDFGQPSAVHAAVTAGSRIVALTVPAEPRTTLNIGRIEGGDGVNVIAASAEFVLDLRSLDAMILADLGATVESVIESTAAALGVEVSIQEVGSRPAAAIEGQHPLVELCRAAIEHLGMKAERTAGSTDANIPLHLGVPALALGITRGSGIHSLTETVETGPMTRGVQQLVLVCAALGDAA